MSNKQSSIDWLIERFYANEGMITTAQLEQAKRMHKEEIIDAVGIGSQFDRDYLYGYHDKAEQYYNETFEGGNK